MRHFIGYFLFGIAVSAWAQPANLQVASVTDRQIVLSYTASSSNACTVEASEDSSYSPVVHDVNGTMFAGANADLSRPSTVVNGLHRTVVIGKTGGTFDDTGSVPGVTVRRSKALRQDTQHYVRVTCDGMSGTITAQTNSYPLGRVSNNDQLPVHEDGLKSAMPSTSPKLQPSFIDPITGTKRAWYTNEFGGLLGGVPVTMSSTGVPLAYVEDQGASWSATSGTMANAIATRDDSIYLQVDSNNVWVFLGLADSGSTVPYSSSYSYADLAFQNFIVKGLCSGTGCGSGIDADLCFVDFDIDATKCKATAKATFTTTNTEIVWCSDLPCTTENEVGDYIGPDVIETQEWGLGDGRIWNTSADYSIINFEMQSDCDRLRVGDRMLWYDASASRQSTVSSKSCASSPPNVVIASTTLTADANGTAGMAFYTDAGARYNQRFGLMIRKNANIANATLQIDFAGWRSHLADSILTGYQTGYAGMGRGTSGSNENCQLVTTTNGWRLCAGYYNFWARKPNTAGDCSTIPTDEECIIWLGSGRMLSTTFNSLISDANMSGVQYLTLASEKFTWDDDEPGVFYYPYTTNWTSPYTGNTAHGLARFKFQYPETPCGTGLTSLTCPDVFNASIDSRMPVPDFGGGGTYALTACLNTCAAPSDDYSIEGQINRAFASEWADWGARYGTPLLIDPVQNHMILYSREASSQNSLGWAVAFDTGNGLPIGGGYVSGHTGTYSTQQIYSMYNVGQEAFGGIHSPYVSDTVDVWAIEHTENSTLFWRTYMSNSLSSCSKSGSGTCGSCDSLLTNGTTVDMGPRGSVDYSGLNICDQVTLTSSWDAGWETQPSWYNTGDPVRDAGAPSCGTVCNTSYHGVRELRVGDRLVHYSPNEIIRVLQINTPSTDVIVERGFHYDQASSFAPSAQTPDYWAMLSNSDHAWYLDARIVYNQTGAIWNFANDTNGSQAFPWPYVGHNITCDGSASVRPQYYGIICNSGDLTSLQASDESRYTLPYTFAGVSSGVGPGNCPQKHPNYGNAHASGVRSAFWVDAHPQGCVGGTINATLISGDIWDIGYTGQTIDPKLYPITAYLAEFPFHNISGPSSALASDSTGRGDLCIALVANECFTGSTAGHVYVNGPVDETNDYCSSAYTVPVLCLTDMSVFVAKSAQWRTFTANGQTLAYNQWRPVATQHRYHANEFSSLKMSRDGRYGFDSNSATYTVIPSWPGVDTVNRTTFIPVSVTVNNVPTGATRFYVKYGYNESFECSINRTEACYAVSSTIDESNPFLWETELLNTDGIDLSTGSSWTIQIPTLDGYIIYAQKIYTDGAGNTVFVGPVEIY